MRELWLLLTLAWALGCFAADTSAKSDDENRPGLQASQVLKVVNLTNIVQAEFVAWTARRDQVVLVGKSGTNHVAVVACRDGDSPSLWKLPVVEVRMVDGGRWIRGQWYYDHPPKRSEIEGLIRLLLHVEPAGGFTFRQGF